MVDHVNMIAIKVQKSTMYLWRLILNNGGPRYGIRKVFDPAVQSVLMYADLIEQKALVYNKSRKNLEEA